MPFFLTPKYSKPQRKSAAYCTPLSLGLEALLRGNATQPPAETGANSLPNTARVPDRNGTSLPKADHCADGRDIGDMLRQPAQPKMTPAEDRNNETQ
ncbi:Hypothetical predicted protein, partial [Pelobates cultripes]